MITYMPGGPISGQCLLFSCISVNPTRYFLKFKCDLLEVDMSHYCNPHFLMDENC